MGTISVDIFRQRRVDKADLEKLQAEVSRARGGAIGEKIYRTIVGVVMTSGTQTISWEQVAAPYILTPFVVDKLTFHELGETREFSQFLGGPEDIRLVRKHSIAVLEEEVSSDRLSAEERDAWSALRKKIQPGDAVWAYERHHGGPVGGLEEGLALVRDEQIVCAFQTDFSL